MMNHSWDCFVDDDDWLVVRCECGTELGVVEEGDSETACDFLMAHAFAEGFAEQATGSVPLAGGHS